MTQSKQLEKQKIRLFAWALIFCNALFCFCDSPTMGIRFYLPIFLPALGIGIISFFKNNIKLGIEHLTCGILFLIVILHLGNSLDNFGEKNTSLFSTNILIFFFFVFSAFRYNLKEVKYIINSLVIAGTGFSILLFLFSFHLGLGHYTIKQFNGYYQYIDPNYLSSFMIIPCIILMKRAIFTNRNFLNTLLFLINILAVLLTGSRAAMLSVMLALIILLIVNKNKKTFFILFIMAIFIGFGVFLFLDTNVIERLFINSYVDGSNHLRFIFWISHIAFVIKTSPIIGLGLSYNQYSWDLYHTSHSTFISLFASFGLVGVIFIFILFLRIFKNLFSKDSILFLALFVAFIFVNQMIPAQISYSFWGILLIFIIIVHFKQDYPEISLWKEL